MLRPRFQCFVQKHSRASINVLVKEMRSLGLNVELTSVETPEEDEWPQAAE